MAEITRDDLRAAVAAGHLSEAQAASVMALAARRLEGRSALPAEDEPFELFKGFAEIFVTVGLFILIFGVFGMIWFAGGRAAFILLIPIAALLAEYFTRRRRMVLPSILLTLTLAGSVLASFLGIPIFGYASVLSDPSLSLALGVTAVALLVWFLRYRVPFSMFLVGLCVLGILLSAAKAVDPGIAPAQAVNLFDLSSGSMLGLAMLVFGALALAGGIWFDMRDPHRLGRQSASGFWLHVLAAPALVNTLALTFYHMGPGAGYALLTLALVAAAVLALVIDRRSFFTAGIGYMIFLSFYAFGDATNPRSWWLVLILIGLALTGLGAFWTELRGRVMRLLSDFPGKSRLPPFATE
ncbi:hypothetical protein SAMN05216224_104168 [Thioclava dalianensis]|uniref:hypothetical protein n=1 Tax=Thioclava dalianensis TaxID=1185766 RepID=UPI0008F62311|nr:hypothetical protein [Thioclava dalianensis]SFN33264.1 hypothetical protein SAMN05216224_104168 [Thioclava dalianensis]